MVEDPAVIGQWSRVIQWPHPAIHTHVLPTGKVLWWPSNNGANHTHTHAYTWDPRHNAALNDFPNGALIEHQNEMSDVFCGGHSFLSDGRLLVAGGHKDINRGIPDTNVFDPMTDTWTRVQNMNAGRWYPTTTTLGNGEVLTTSGTDEGGGFNRVPQVWQSTSGWRDLTNALTIADYDYYPWMHVAPNGKVFLAGPWATTRYLDTTGSGAWTDVATTNYGFRDEYTGSSVMYAPGKVLIVGGGRRFVEATNTAEVIDLNAPSPAWRYVAPMQYPRRNINATVLPDGKVLVTGGTSHPNDTDCVGPNPDCQAENARVLPAEIWDSATEQWTTVASLAEPRMYHSTAVLLPDGRVLSAGGGQGGGYVEHKTAQVYSPPYLFKGARPTITSVPTDRIGYGQRFFVGSPDANVSRVTLVRLPSVTHSFDENQRFVDLSASIQPASGGLSVAAPANGNLCPPGHYMMFLLNAQGVPSAARIIQIGGTGLRGEYYSGVNFDAPVLARTDATVNFDWGTESPAAGLPADNYSVRWTGQVQPRYSEEYTFHTSTDDGVRLWVNGELLFSDWRDQGGEDEQTGRIQLQAGQRYDIRMEYYEHGGLALARLMWSSQSQPKEIIPQSQLYPPPLSNIALGTSPTQSSLAHGGFPVRAVDGNTDGNWYAETTTHTDYDAEAWWEVDLGSVQRIDRIDVWNRTENVPERLSNFHIL